MPLSVGDQLTYGSATGTVRAVTSTADANGRGSVTYNGATFHFRALKATVAGTDYPLVATSDAVFRVGLVQQDSNPLLFVLCLDDGPGPWGWGRDVDGVGGDGWSEAAYYSTTDAVVFRMGWVPGTITIKRGTITGTTTMVGIFADLMLTYATSDGTHETWWPPVSPNPEAVGRFVTIAGGILQERLPDGSTKPIIVPKGLGAIGHRAQDIWPGGPTSERLLSKVEVWYLQEHLEVSEGTATDLTIGYVSILVTGPAGANVDLLWEGALVRGTGSLGASGTTFTRLPPGRYTVAGYHPTDADKGLARVTVDATTPGSTYTAALAASYTTVPSGNIQGIVYAYGAEPAAGATIYEWKAGLPGEFVLLTTCDANGAFGPVTPVWGQADYMAYHPEWGAVGFNDASPTITRWFDPQLSGRFGGIRSSKWIGYEPDDEGVFPWGAYGDHENLNIRCELGWAQDESTGEKFYFETLDAGGAVTAPCPGGHWSPPGSTASYATAFYSIYDADGTLLESGLWHSYSARPMWTGGSAWQQSITGLRIYLSMGGKIDGNALIHKPSQVITTNDFVETSRMGLETGDWKQPLEARYKSEALIAKGVTTWTLAMQAWECPAQACGGPAHMGPDTATYTRGYCERCADLGYTTDCRTWWLSATMISSTDWSTRLVRNTTGGGHTDRFIQGWPRPEEYDETAGYLETNWLGLGRNRYVATHLILGYLVDGIFTDGESIAQAESRLGRTVGPVQLKFLLLHDYTGIGCQVHITATRWDGISVILKGALTTGMKAGEFVLLKTCPHSDYPTDSWFVDVTNIAQFGSPGMGFVSGQVVNDGPAWHSSAGVQITRGAYSPFACDVALGGREPYLVTEATGLLHCVYLRDGQVMHATKEYGKQFDHIYSVTARAGWFQYCRRPCIARLYRSGGLLVSATSAGVTKFWYSSTNGDSWTSLPDLGLTLVEFLVRPREGFLDLVGLSGNILMYGLSDTNGQTWNLATVYEGVDSQVPPTLTVQNGRVYVQARVSGETKTWFDDGSQWRFAGS